VTLRVSVPYSGGYSFEYLFASVLHISLIYAGRCSSLLSISQSLSYRFFQNLNFYHCHVCDSTNI
jgi:hypothetical protein